MAKTFKTGGVPFCWHCGKQLMRKKGGFYFALVGDPSGHEHRVHKDCLRLVLGDGIREIGGNYATRKVGAGGTAVEVTDEMAVAFHRSITDGPIGVDDVIELKKALRAALAVHNAALRGAEPASSAERPLEGTVMQQEVAK